eukprot:1141360-Pelagomonas_calceolata.AAC.6
MRAGGSEARVGPAQPATHARVTRALTVRGSVSMTTRRRNCGHRGAWSQGYVAHLDMKETFP